MPVSVNLFMVNRTWRPRPEYQASSWLLADTFFLSPSCYFEDPVATLPCCSNILPPAAPLCSVPLPSGATPTPKFPGGLPSPWLPPPGLLCALGGLPGPPLWPSHFHPPLPGSTRDLITLPHVNSIPAPAVHISAGSSSLGFNHTFLH